MGGQDAGGRRKASPELKAAYRSLMREVHPDLAGSDAEKSRRHRFAAAATAAFQRQDEGGLSRLLQEWRDEEAERVRDPEGHEARERERSRRAVEELHRRAREAEELAAGVQRRNGRIADLEAEVRKLRAQVREAEELAAGVQRRNGRISDLEAEVRKLRAQVREAEEQTAGVQRRNGRIADLEAEVQKLRAQVGAAIVWEVAEGIASIVWLVGGAIAAVGQRLFAWSRNRTAGLELGCAGWVVTIAVLGWLAMFILLLSIRGC